MTIVVSTLDDIEQRLMELDSRLPAQRSADECEAIDAMTTCVGELRRLSLLIMPARQRQAAAADQATHAELTLVMQRLLHDIRTPAGVLYTYLRLIAERHMFAQAAPDDRVEAAELAVLVRCVREQASEH